MTSPFPIRSLHHKSKAEDYETKHSRAVRYLNETQSNTYHIKKAGATVAIFFLIMILILSITVAAVSYLEQHDVFHL